MWGSPKFLARRFWRSNSTGSKAWGLWDPGNAGPGVYLRNEMGTSNATGWRQNARLSETPGPAFIYNPNPQDSDRTWGSPECRARRLETKFDRVQSVGLIGSPNVEIPEMPARRLFAYVWTSKPTGSRHCVGFLESLGPAFMYNPKPQNSDQTWGSPVFICSPAYRNSMRHNRIDSKRAAIRNDAPNVIVLGSRSNTGLWGSEMPGPAFIGVGSAGEYLGNARSGVFVASLYLETSNSTGARPSVGLPEMPGPAFVCTPEFPNMPPHQACSSRKCRSLPERHGLPRGAGGC